MPSGKALERAAVTLSGMHIQKGALFIILPSRNDVREAMDKDPRKKICWGVQGLSNKACRSKLPVHQRFGLSSSARRREASIVESQVGSGRLLAVSSSPSPDARPPDGPPE